MTDDLIRQFETKTVFATPAGFLANGELPHLMERNIRMIGTKAISVLLLPSENPFETVDMIVARQLARYPENESFLEWERYIWRHGVYKEHGTIKIIGQYALEETIDQIIKRLTIEELGVKT